MGFYQSIPLSVSIPLTLGAIVCTFYLVAYAISIVTGFIRLVFTEGLSVLTEKRITVPFCNSSVKTDGEYVYFTDEQQKQVLAGIQQRKAQMAEAEASMNKYMFTDNLSWLISVYPNAFYKLALDYYLNDNSDIRNIIGKIESSKRENVISQLVSQEQIESVITSDEFKTWITNSVGSRSLSMSLVVALNDKYSNKEQIVKDTLNQVVS